MTRTRLCLRARPSTRRCFPHTNNRPRSAQTMSAVSHKYHAGKNRFTYCFLALVPLVVCHLIGLAGAQSSLEIKKTIKEQLLPGSVVADLLSDPGFLAESQQHAEETGTSLPTASTADTSGKNDAMHFSVLTSGNAQANYFAVDERTGVVVVREEIDRELVCSFRLECVLVFEVAARSDLGSFFLMVRFSVTITDINDNNPEFPEPQFELNVPEESDAGRRYPLPTAFDRDTGPGNGVEEYRMLDGPPMFHLGTEETSLNATALFLTLESVVNRESSESYTILVGALDGGLPPLTGTLTVEVQISDINDNFPVFEQSVYTATIPENFGRDHPVQTVSATDADSGPNGELEYAFSTQQPADDLSLFHVDSLSGSIYLSQSIESRSGQTIELIVEARDKGHPPKVTTARVEVIVEDTINSMPTIIADALGGAGGVAEVSEYAVPGKVVAHVSVMDPDSGPNGETNCLLDKSEFALEILGDDGSQFTAVLASTLDRETVDFYNVTVTCSDSGLPSLRTEKRFSVRVLDENDQDPVFSPRSYQVIMPENNTVGKVITELSATDGDIGINAELTFEVAGINNQYFEVDKLGVMRALLPLDREDSSLMVATVFASDGGNPTRSATATVTVTLTDVNDWPPEFDNMVDGDNYRFFVAEGLPAGQFVGIVSASDRDEGLNQEVFYLLPNMSLSPAGESSLLFAVDTVEGTITLTEPLDREETAVHMFLILAVDKGTPPLTGTATVIVEVTDINDNDPVFEFPVARVSTSGTDDSIVHDWDNDTVTIPHTWDPAEPIVTIRAVDKDSGLNSRIVYTLSSINDSSPFSINSDSGAVQLDMELDPEDVGLYFLTVAATDQGASEQRSIQAPLYVDVYFDNSTLLIGGSGRGGASQALVMGVIGAAIVLVLLVLVLVVVVCLKRSSAARNKLGGGMPNSASTSSTAKLHGGYYIAPGVRDSTDSILAGKQNSGGRAGNYNKAAGRFTMVDNEEDEENDGMRTANPYVVMFPRPENSMPSENIEFSRTSGHVSGLSNASRSAIDLDSPNKSAVMFSTFKSEDDILSSGINNGSHRRESHDTSSIAKGDVNDTFDETSNEEDSTSDSGRGGSEVDVNNGAAALANKEKARMRAATPLSMKSGISNRLSPLPRTQESEPGQRTFVTFRGESPSSFRFDSDTDTLPRRRGGRVPPSPGVPSSPPPLTDSINDDTLVAPPERRFDFSSPHPRLSESDGGSGTDSELGAVAFPRGRLQNLRRPLFPGTSTPNTVSSGVQYPHPQHVAGIYSPNVSVSSLNGAPNFSSGYHPGRLPPRVPPLVPVLPTHLTLSSRPDSESESQLSDGSSSNNPSSGQPRSVRSSHIPRLPFFPNIEFSHHAYGGSNRNSIGAFSNNSAHSDLPPYHYYNQNNNHNTNDLNSASPAADYQPRGLRPRSSGSSSSQGVFSAYNNDPNSGPDRRVSANYGNVVSELQDSRPVSMEEDMLLPPYPEVEAELDPQNGVDDQLNVHSGYTGFSPHKQNEEERAALFESSA